MYQDLAAFYKNPKVPNSFGGVEALHRSLKGKYSKKDVKPWLSQKDAYTLHKPVRHKFQRNQVFLALPKNNNRFTTNYNKATKRLKINSVQGSSLHLENLGVVLGFERNAIITGNMKSEFVADAWSNFSVFYVYSDPISPQIVGDTQTPLLRIVRTKGQDGETISQYYDRPQYLPLVRHSFQTIQAELRFNSGDFVPFERDVSLNDRVVSNSSNTYPYRSYIETLLSHGYDSKTSQLTAELFFKDSDDGLKERTEFFKESATVDMIGCIHSDLFHQDRLLLNLVDLRSN
ncbi:uncharacterized protein TNIN_238661 [Trichonephila inaurata madagascariensis]|uniref:Uncharacterized protein n=1 Tax=Trichonephila inaurata madagascariensis TaxID=2747483 RepID=A0A8X6WW43_9ARAC|nr:uncharacterized protein TNIN_238661 [Trichonephila inaurata madagascariensis]